MKASSESGLWAMLISWTAVAAGFIRSFWFTECQLMRCAEEERRLGGMESEVSFVPIWKLWHGRACCKCRLRRGF